MDRIAELSDELESIDAQIATLKELRTSIVKERSALQAEAQQHGSSSSSSSSIGVQRDGSARSSNGRNGGGTIDYYKEKFPWSRELLPRARQIWGIDAFRSVQEAVCNAAIDGRDIVCVMPTGGGKSLCYQLPAIINQGLTLVVSPLLSLSTDQVWHLKEVGIPCEMMSSADTREESNEILRRIKFGSAASGDELKVLFVTPERIATSKTLLSALQKCYERDLLARIVIDEAHCCSQMGHDFRPDYKKLSILRKVYPNVPFLCLSATLAPNVLEDVRHILGLPAIVDAAHAPMNGTLYFTAPLHRPNLHYSVVCRPNASKEANQAITNYILEHHRGESGIVYILSRADTQRMADALNDLSGGAIRAAVYHADLDDTQKATIHHRWRHNDIQVVVATIAFGMGIDKGNVRFVLHATLGKSIDSYYQETGRAGRDGDDADCVLFYRPADAARVSGMLAGDPGGQQKLHSMLEYAQSAVCRKSIFGHYFQDRFGDGSACGSCDNCTSPPQEVDVTGEAWKLLRVLEEVYSEGGRITLAGLADLARGLNGGQYTVVEASQGKRKRHRSSKGAKQSGFLDIGHTAGEKVQLSRDDTERVLIALHLKGYIADEYNATAYSVNVYARPGPMSLRLTRHTAEEVASKIGCPTISVAMAERPKKGSRVAASSSARSSGGAANNGVQRDKSTKQRKTKCRDEPDDMIESFEEEEAEASSEDNMPLQSSHTGKRKTTNTQSSSTTRTPQQSFPACVKNEKGRQAALKMSPNIAARDYETLGGLQSSESFLNDDISHKLPLENGRRVYTKRSARNRTYPTAGTGDTEYSPIELDSD